MERPQRDDLRHEIEVAVGVALPRQGHVQPELALDVADMESVLSEFTAQLDAGETIHAPDYAEAAA